MMEIPRWFLPFSKLIDKRFSYARTITADKARASQWYSGEVAGGQARRNVEREPNNRYVTNTVKLRQYIQNKYLYA